MSESEILKSTLGHSGQPSVRAVVTATPTVANHPMVHVTLLQLTSTQRAFWISHSAKQAHNSWILHLPCSWYGPQAMYLWYNVGTQKLHLSPNNSTYCSQMFMLKPTCYFTGAGIPTLSLPSYALFNLHNSSWVINYKTCDYTTFCFGFVLPCWTWKTKTLPQVSYSSCIPIAQKGKTHLLAL